MNRLARWFIIALVFGELGKPIPMTANSSAHPDVIELFRQGQIAELKALFADQHWLAVRVAQATYSSYLADLHVAWEASETLAQQQIEADQDPSALLDLLHYALIETSLRSWAESLTPGIVAQAVAINLWTPELALSVAALIPDPQRQAELYAALSAVQNLSAKQSAGAKTDALDTAQTIDFAASRAFTLTKIVQQTDSDQQIQAATAALDAAIEAADGPYGGNGFNLWQLIPTLPEALIELAVTKVLTLKNPEAKAWAIAELAKRIAPDRRDALLWQGVEAASLISQDITQANALAQLSPQLGGDLVSRALDLALAMQESQWLPRAIAGLMAKLDSTQIARLLDRVLTIADEWWRADGLMAIVEQSTAEPQRRALLVLLDTRHEEAQQKIRRWLEKLGSAELLNTAHDLTAQLTDPDHRSRIVEMLNALKSPAAPTNPAPQIDDSTLDTILQMDYDEDRAQHLAYLAPQLPESLLPRALDIALDITDRIWRDHVLNGLAPRLSAKLLVRALEAWTDQEELSLRSQTVHYLALHLDEGTQQKPLQYALDCAQRLVNDWRRIESLVGLLRNLQGDLREKGEAALAEIISRVPVEVYSLQSLVPVISYLHGEQRTQLLNECLNLLWTDKDTTFLNSADDPDAEDRTTWQKIRIATVVIDELTGDQKQQTIKTAFDLTLTIRDEMILAASLIDLARHLEGDKLKTALETALNLKSERYRVNALVWGLIEYLPLEYFLRELDLAKTIENPCRRAELLIALAKKSEGQQRANLLTQAYEDIMQEASQGMRVRLLWGLVRFDVAGAAEQGIEMALAIDDDKERVATLGDFLPILKDKHEVVKHMRRGLLPTLKKVRSESRLSFLEFCADAMLFAAPVMSPDAPLIVIRDIETICDQWRWPSS
jgi:hypothetical protein